ncbi:MAG: hypothetical protein R3D58_02235 [Saprospiraceae bacterium]
MIQGLQTLATNILQFIHTSTRSAAEVTRLWTSFPGNQITMRLRRHSLQNVFNVYPMERKIYTTSKFAILLFLPLALLVSLPAEKVDLFD